MTIASASQESASATVVQLGSAMEHARQRAARLGTAFLAARTPNTRLAYEAGLNCFRQFLGLESTTEAIAHLLVLRSGEAHELALNYLESLRRQSLASGTIMLRTSALRCLATMARTLGFIDWTFKLPSPRHEPYRDTRGPEAKGVALMLKAAASHESPDRAARDTAVVRLMFDLALRRSEVANIDLDDIDLTSRTVHVLGKGRRHKVALSMPPRTAAALRTYLALRTEAPSRALFVNRSGKRLTTMGLYRIIRTLGDEVGLRVRPHGLRHAAITTALDATKGDVRAVQRFSRHRDISTLLIYDDNRADVAGSVARRVARRVASIEATRGMRRRGAR